MIRLVDQGRQVKTEVGQGQVNWMSRAWLIRALARDSAPQRFDNKKRRPSALRFLVYRLSASQSLELEAGAELDLERRARVVGQDEVTTGILGLEEVHIARRSEAAINRNRRGAVIAHCAAGKLNIRQVRQDEELDRENQPPILAKTDAFLPAQVNVVLRQVAEGVAFEWHARGAVWTIRAAEVAVGVSEAGAYLNRQRRTQPDCARNLEAPWRSEERGGDELMATIQARIVELRRQVERVLVSEATRVAFIVVVRERATEGVESAHLIPLAPDVRAHGHRLVDRAGR